MTLFERIKSTAKSKGLTLLQVTSKAGLGDKTIYKWKTQNPKAETLQKVADVLNVSVDYLLGNTDSPSVTPVSTSKSTAVDLSEDVPFAFEGREIPPEQMEIVRQMLANFKDKGDDDK